MPGNPLIRAFTQPFSKSVYFPLAYNEKFMTLSIKVKKKTKIGFRLLLLEGKFQW